MWTLYFTIQRRQSSKYLLTTSSPLFILCYTVKTEHAPGHGTGLLGSWAPSSLMAGSFQDPTLCPEGSKEEPARGGGAVVVPGRDLPKLSFEPLLQQMPPSASLKASVNSLKIRITPEFLGCSPHWSLCPHPTCIWLETESANVPYWLRTLRFLSHSQQKQSPLWDP